MRASRIAGLALLLALAASAASAQSTKPQAAAASAGAPSDNLSSVLVYIYRTPHFAIGAGTSMFYVDEAQVATMTFAGCVSVVVAPGAHSIRERWLAIPVLDGNFARPLEIRTDLAPGGPYYFRFETGVGHSRFGAMELQWRLSPVPEETGRAEVAKLSCRTAPSAAGGAAVNAPAAPSTTPGPG